MNSNDRRVRKTKKALRTALAELMAEKDIHSITVRELTDKADIHRATFYTHYRDVYDLYDQLENSVLERIGATVVSMPTHTYDSIYKAVIDYVCEDTALCKIFLGTNSNHKFQNHISKLLEESYLKIWMFEENITEITEEMRYLTTYHISGCLAIISRWIDSNFSYSREEVIELIRKVNDNTD